MSSMLTPFEPSSKATAEQQQQEHEQQSHLQHGQQQQQHSQTQMATERIPTYAESSNLPLPSLLPPIPDPDPETQPAAAQPSPSTIPTDLPPAYTPLDTHQTTFMIHGTFIHTPAGPAYHLSSSLDTRGSPFRIRRLSPREVALVGTSPIAFQKADTLYEIFDPPLLENEVQVRGKRASCLPGVLELKFRITGWKVRQKLSSHGAGGNDKGREIMTSKRLSTLGRTTLNRRREEETSSQWKDPQNKNRILATEYLKPLPADHGGGVVPVIELSEELDQTWREAVLSVWVARLWWAFGKEKSAVLGGRLDGRWVKLSGAAVLGGGWTGVGVVAAT